MPTVGDRIYERRIGLGLSQRELGLASGLAPAYISCCELDRRHPSVKALRKLAPLLDVSVYWLENGREDPAEELARLVLEEPFTSALATDLARAVIRERHRVSDELAATSQKRRRTAGVRWTA